MVLTMRQLILLKEEQALSEQAFPSLTANQIEQMSDPRVIQHEWKYLAAIRTHMAPAWGVWGVGNVQG